MSPSLTEDNVWRRNPFTGTLAGDTSESKDKNYNNEAKKYTPAPEKGSHNTTIKGSNTSTKLRDEKENHHPQPKFRNQRKSSPGGCKLKQNTKKGNYEGKNRKATHQLSWPLAIQESKGSTLYAEHKTDLLDPKEEQYCNMVENMLKELLLGEKEKRHYTRMEKYFPSPNYKYSLMPQWYEENIYNTEFLENDDWYTKPLENIFAIPISKAQRLYKRHSFPPAVFTCDDRLNWEDLFPDPVLYLEKPKESYQGISSEANSDSGEISKEVIKSDDELKCNESKVQDNEDVAYEDNLKVSSQVMSEMSQSESTGSEHNADITSAVHNVPLVCILSDTEADECSDIVEVAVTENDVNTSCSMSALLMKERKDDEADVIDELLKSIEKHWDVFAVSNDASSTVSSSDKGCLSDTTEASPCITDVSQQASPFPDMLLLMNYGEDSKSEPGIHLFNSNDNNFATLVDMQNVFRPDFTESSIFEDVQWDNTTTKQELGKDWLPYNMRSCNLTEVFEDEAGGGEDYVRLQNTLEGSLFEGNPQLDNMASERESEKYIFPFTMLTCSLSDDTDNTSGESFGDVKCILDSCQEQDASSVLFNLGSDDDDDNFVENKGPMLKELSVIGIGRREHAIDESACFPTDLLSSFGSVGDYSGSSDCLLFGLPQLVDTSYLLDLFGLSETGPRVSRSPAFLFHLTPGNERSSSCWHNRVFLDDFDCSLSFEEFCQSSPRMFWDDLLKNEMPNVETISPGQLSTKPLYHLWDVNSNKKVPQISDASNVWNSILNLCLLTPEFTVGDDVFASQSHGTDDALAVEESVLDLQFLEELNENKHLFDKSFFEGSLPKFWHSSWTHESFDSTLSPNYGLVPSKNSAFMGVVPRGFHHVQSAPNLTYSRLLSPLLRSDSFEKSHQSHYSPTEHLYFSAKTHFRPIQTPVGTPDAEYQPNDLFGGATVSTDTPYQQYCDVTDDQELKFRPKFKILKYLDKYIQTGSSLDENSVAGSDRTTAGCKIEKQKSCHNTPDWPTIAQEQTVVVTAKEKSEEGSVSNFPNGIENPGFEKHETDDEAVSSVPPGFEKFTPYQSSINNVDDKDKKQADDGMPNSNISFHSVVVGSISSWMDDLRHSSDSPENHLESEMTPVVSSDNSEHSDVFTQAENNKGKQDLGLWDFPQTSECESIWRPLQPTMENSELVDVAVRPTRPDAVSMWNHSAEIKNDKGPSETKNAARGIWNMQMSEIENEQSIWEVRSCDVENEEGSVWKVPTSESPDKTTVQCTPFLKWAFSVESDYEVNIESIWQPPGSCGSPDLLIWDKKLGQDDKIAVDQDSVWAVRKTKDKILSLEKTSLKDIWSSESKAESFQHIAEEEDYGLLTTNYSVENSWSVGYEKLYLSNEKSDFILAQNKEESPRSHCYQSDEQSNMYCKEAEPTDPLDTMCETVQFFDDGEVDNNSDELYNYYLQNYPEMESFVLSSDLEECTEKQVH